MQRYTDKPGSPGFGSYLRVVNGYDMRGNTFGRIFRIHTYGESHGPGIGVVIDGCPAGYAVNIEEIQQELDRRKPGQSALTTDRNESDQVQIFSGLLDGITTGTPISMFIANKDARPGDYKPLSQLYRPSHADYTWEQKFGIRDARGGGRSSARETAARVAAGALAAILLRQVGVAVHAWVTQVGPIAMQQQPDLITRADIDRNAVRCPDPTVAFLMDQYILELKEAGDSTGGVIMARITGCPPGWGEPVFDKLHADLGKAILSINACKGFEIGSGFAGVALRGSEHNDPFEESEGRVRTTTNHSGGIQGGISNGMPIEFRAAFKPVATIRKEQQTIDMTGQSVQFAGTGRHDPCVVPRAVPIVEAMTNLVLVDHFLRQKTSQR